MGVHPFRDPAITDEFAAPDYPMQVMIAVFDFPGKATSAPDAEHVPALAVDSVASSLPAT